MNTAAWSDIINHIIEWMTKYINSPLPTDTARAVADVITLIISKTAMLLEEYQIWMK